MDQAIAWHVVMYARVAAAPGSNRNVPESCAASGTISQFEQYSSRMLYNVIITIP